MAHSTSQSSPPVIETSPRDEATHASRNWREGLPQLRADGVVLREPRMADAASLCGALANADVARFMSMPPESTAGFEKFIVWIQGEREAGRFFCYALFKEGSDEAVGLLQVRQLESGFGRAEWGFALCPGLWGTGLFMAAAKIVVDFAFRFVGVHRLEARSCTENVRGNGALAKLKATCEGTLRQSLPDVRPIRDQFLFALLEDDWLPTHPEPAYEITWVGAGARETLWRRAPSANAIAVPPWRQALPHLRGATWTLREVGTADAAPLVAMLSDPLVRRFIAPPPSSPEDFEQFVSWAQRQRAIGRFVCFSLIADSTGLPVGLFQLRPLDPGFQTAEWGFAVGSPHWGTGLFVDAATQVLDWTFGTLGTRRLEARAAVANQRANAALKKLSHVQEGRLRRSFLLDDQYLDDALWALLSEDWRRRPDDLRRPA